MNFFKIIGDALGLTSQAEAANATNKIPRTEMQAYRNMVESDEYAVLESAMDKVFGRSGSAMAPVEHPQVERLNALKGWMQAVQHAAYEATDKKKLTDAHAGLRQLGDLTYEQIGLSTNEHNAYNAIRATFEPYYNVIHDLRGRRPNHWEPGMQEPEYDPPRQGGDPIIDVSLPDDNHPRLT